MTQSKTSALLLGLGLLNCIAAAAPAFKPANDRVLAQAQTILTNAHSSHYNHTTKVDTKKGLYDVDCSGLANLILKNAAPVCYDELPIEKGQRRPRAVSFYTAFTNSPSAEPTTNHWRQITRVPDAQPGDFIAWRKPVILPKSTSGHVMVIVSKPAGESDGSFRVVVLDSTSTPHSADTRSHATGVGQGTIWLEVDAGGKPIGFRWSTKQKKFKHCPVAIGRPCVSTPPKH